MKTRFTVMALLACVLLICATDAHTVLGAAAGPSVAKYVRPDGRMDLEAMRASGYQGPLDLEGYDVRLDRRSDEPLVRRSGTGRALDNPDDAYWSEGFGIPGVAWNVLALTVYDNKLIAGGWLSAAGNIPVNSIAAWDGSAWSPLGLGMDSAVHALTVYDGKLIAGGEFTMTGDVEADYIASWDGSTWSALGSGMNSTVSALTVYDGKLVAGGEFTMAGGVETNGIAAWDGSAWSPLGSGMNSTVSALTVYDGKLIAGGAFTTADGAEAKCIAAWDGSAWSPLGSGLTGGWDDPSVYALTVYDSNLVAAGYFFVAGDSLANSIAMWDGASWTPLASELFMASAVIEALIVYDNKLIMGTDGVWAWDGSAWSELGSEGTPPMIRALAGYGNKLLAGGDSFKEINGVGAVGVAAWDGSVWSRLGSGMNNDVNALTAYDGKLIAGGRFITAGDVDASRIAAWDGFAWSPLGSGMDDIVLALAVYHNRLIAGGYFHTAGGVPADHIAAWDDSTWSPLGSGMDGGVWALTIFDNQLIFGGSFTTAGGIEAKYIAAWDGDTWSALGSGMNSSVHALTVYNHMLIAGGLFTTAGGVSASRIAAWDGSSWRDLGSGVEYGPLPASTEVSALAVYDNTLIAGGYFITAGGVEANRIAAWDGSSWSGLGSGMNCNCDVHALIVYDTKLVAGGAIGTAGGVEALGIAAWDGSAWFPLGSGVKGSVWALGVYNNTLMVGGKFSVAGDKASGHIGQWTKQTSGATTLQSFSASHEGSAIEIEWQLSEQVSNERFVIERAGTPAGRADDTGNFAELDVAAITQNGLHYRFSDADIKPGMAYRYRVALRSEVGSREVLFETEAIAIPALALTLFQNQPNPFNPSTKIRYYLPEDTEVTLGVYDAAGRLVASLAEREKQPSGYHELEWNGRDGSGKAVASGVYFCRLQAGKLTQSRKMIVLR